MRSLKRLMFYSHNNCKTIVWIVIVVGSLELFITSQINTCTKRTNVPVKTLHQITAKRVQLKNLQEASSEQRAVDEYTEVLCSLETVRLSESGSDGVDHCPCVPSTITNEVEINIPYLTNLSWADVDNTLPGLSAGGYWRPRHCTARRRVAVIIPYRNREAHLRAFLAHTHPVLQKQQVEYQIFVIEQNAPAVFNKGSLMNIGYLEVVEKSSFAPDCLVFHDVDLLVETDRNLFICGDRVIHFAPYIDKFDYTLPYSQLFGGAVALTPAQFKMLNGYSNKFSGWGGEDDNFSYRVNKHIGKRRPPKEIARYKMIPHDRDLGNPTNPNAFDDLRRDYKNTDGADSVNYVTISIDYLHSHTRILVNVTKKNKHSDHKASREHEGIYQRKCIDPYLIPKYMSLDTCESTCLLARECVGFQSYQNKGKDVCEILSELCSDWAPQDDVYIHMF